MFYPVAFDSNIIIFETNKKMQQQRYKLISQNDSYTSLIDVKQKYLYVLEYDHWYAWYVFCLQ